MGYLGVSGASGASTEEYDAARTIGRWAAERGHVVVCGGLGGVMEAAARGAQEAGGICLGLLPGDERGEGNAYLTLAVPTGLGEMRNALLVRASDAVVCVGGSWGTLSELALAVRTGVPVVALGGWDLPAAGPRRVTSVQDALAALDDVLAGVHRPRE